MGKHLLGSKKNGQSFMKHLENVQKKQRSVSLINTVVSFFCCHSVVFFVVILSVFFSSFRMFYICVIVFVVYFLNFPFLEGWSEYRWIFQDMFQFIHQHEYVPHRTGFTTWSDKEHWNSQGRYRYTWVHITCTNIFFCIYELFVIFYLFNMVYFIVISCSIYIL